MDDGLMSADTHRSHRRTAGWVLAPMLAVATLWTGSATADPMPVAPGAKQVQARTALPEFALWSRVLGLGMVGTDVRDLQTLLNGRGETLDADGEFGPLTRAAVVRAQIALGLKGGGLVSAGFVNLLRSRATPITLPQPAGGLGSRILRLGMSGPDVRALQRILRKRGLGVTVDGSFGQQTRRAVIRLQRKHGLRGRGLVTPGFLKLLGIRVVRSGAQPPAPISQPVSYPVAAPTATARYLRAFPVGGPHNYTNDWGAPRSQGSHEGTDVMAERGTPVRAVADGTVSRVTRVESGLGGISMWMRDDAGNTFYFAHLTDILAGMEVGARVRAGQQMATVGNTGDARYGAPHLHFEIHPGGGGAINPYPELRAIDPG